jgi:hypothetical protein
MKMAGVEFRNDRAARNALTTSAGIVVAAQKKLPR